MSEVSKEPTEEELIKIVFSNTQGRKLLDLWMKNFVTAPVYYPGSDALEMAFRDGQRAMCIPIYNLIEADK